jgi:hypothetical protein
MFLGAVRMVDWGLVALKNMDEEIEIVIKDEKGKKADDLEASLTGEGIILATHKVYHFRHRLNELEPEQTYLMTASTDLGPILGRLQTSDRAQMPKREEEED